MIGSVAGEDPQVVVEGDLVKDDEGPVEVDQQRDRQHHRGRQRDQRRRSSRAAMAPQQPTPTTSALQGHQSALYEDWKMSFASRNAGTGRHRRCGITNSSTHGYRL